MKLCLQHEVTDESLHSGTVTRSAHKVSVAHFLTFIHTRVTTLEMLTALFAPFPASFHNFFYQFDSTSHDA